MEYCHQCSGWVVASAVVTQHGGDNEVVTPYTEFEFGPFDQVEDVLSFARALITSSVVAPGRPWDPAG